MAQDLYESPPGSGHNDGALPTVYISGWQKFTNLTVQQVVAFESLPEALILYTKERRWQAEISGITVNGALITTALADQQKIAGLKQAIDNATITGNSNFFDGNGNVQDLSPAQVTAMYNAVVSFVKATYDTAATLVTGINATPPSVTTRKAIDAAYAAFAPNSTSAKNSSPT